MKWARRGLIPGGLVSLLLLAGCSAWSPAPQFSQPYFVADSGGAKSLQALTKK